MRDLSTVLAAQRGVSSGIYVRRTCLHTYFLCGAPSLSSRAGVRSTVLFLHRYPHFNAPIFALVTIIVNIFSGVAVEYHASSHDQILGGFLSAAAHPSAHFAELPNHSYFHGPSKADGASFVAPCRTLLRDHPRPTLANSRRILAITVTNHQRHTRLDTVAVFPSPYCRRVRG